MTDMQKMLAIQALIVDQFSCDGGEAQNLARQILERNPQPTAAQITTILMNHFHFTGGAVLGHGAGVSQDIENVLAA